MKISINPANSKVFEGGIDSLDFTKITCIEICDEEK